MSNDSKKLMHMMNFFSLQNYSDIKTEHMPIDYLIQLIYLADRMHLRKYGRLISDDMIIEVNYGTIAQSIRDLRAAKLAFGIPVNAPCDADQFSETDRMCMAKVWKYYGHYTESQLDDIVMSFPECMGMMLSSRCPHDWEKLKLFDCFVPIGFDDFNAVSDRLLQSSLEQFKESIDFNKFFIN